MNLIEAVAVTAAEGPQVDTPRLAAAREGLQSCYGKDESVAAIREYLQALKEAPKAQPIDNQPRKEESQ